MIRFSCFLLFLFLFLLSVVEVKAKSESEEINDSLNNALAIERTSVASNTLLVKEKTKQKRAHNALYLDLLGIGGYFSINYERELYHRDRIGIAFRTGFSGYEMKDFNDNFNPDIILPQSLNLYYGKVHHVEVGMGPTLSLIVKAHPITFKPTRDLLFNINITIGYRYQRPEGGFMFRAGYTPFFQAFRITQTPFIEQKHTFRHWGGVSVGYTF